MSATKTLIILVGPTAVGKTAVSIALAKTLSTEIISADSRQFYRQMNIGTAKPTKAEQSGITHHFIDSQDITDEVTVGSYEREALSKIEALFQKYDQIILTGGSGLYIKSIDQGIDEMPVIPEGTREELIAKYQALGIEWLQTELAKHDPEYYKQVDQKNPQRLMRALEVCIATGQPYSDFRKKTNIERPFRVIKIGLTRDREELYERIEDRMDQMIAQGLFEEVESLQQYRQLNALQTVGYKEIFDFFDGKYDREEAIRLLKRNTRRYAKRQLTWFLKDDEYKWFHPDDLDEIKCYITDQLN